MAPKSKIATELSEADRLDLNRRLADGRHTLDDLVGWLDEMGYRISRSALGRYSHEYQKAIEDIRFTRELAATVRRELADVVDDDATPMLVESLHALLLKARVQVAEAGEIKPKDVADLARAAKDLATALRMRADLVLKIKEETRKEAAAEAAKKIDAATRSAAAAGEKGLSKERIDQLKRDLAGMA